MSQDQKRGEDSVAGRTASSPVLAPLLASALLVGFTGSLAGCHTDATRTATAGRVPGAAGGTGGAAAAASAGAAAQTADDPSYDWHGLLVVPLGSALKEVPLKVHEVLLFRDAASGSGAAGASAGAAGAAAGAAPADDAECYAADSAAPRFLGHVPDQYLLCFRQDRLSRIQASVALPQADAPGVFAAACARWSMKAGSPVAADSVNGGTSAVAAAQAAAASGAVVCAGHEGAIHFSGRLEDEAVSITIDGVLSP